MPEELDADVTVVDTAGPEDDANETNDSDSGSDSEPGYAVASVQDPETGRNVKITDEAYTGDSSDPVDTEELTDGERQDIDVSGPGGSGASGSSSSSSQKSNQQPNNTPAQPKSAPRQSQQRTDNSNNQNEADVQLTDVQGEDGYRLTEDQLRNRIREDRTDNLSPASRTSPSAIRESRRNRTRNIRRQNQFTDPVNRDPRPAPTQTNNIEPRPLNQDFQNNPFVRIENAAADELETSLENVQESTKRARAASDDMSELNPVSITGRTLAGFENIGGEAVDAATGGSFDPLSEDSRSQANDRAQEIEKSIVGAFGGPANAPVDTVKVVGAGLAAPLAGASAEATTGFEYDSEYAGDELRAASAQAIESQVESFIDDPVKEGAVGVLGFGAGSVASKTTRAGVRAGKQIDTNTLPTTQRTSSTFNAGNTNFADTLDPRTGLGRTPQPGEPTPAPFTQQATETASRARNFLEGDLGQRRARPEEIRNRFDDEDLLKGDNLPENPSEPATVERSRRDVLEDFVPNRPSFGSRKGQAQLVSPVQKVKQTVDDIDTTGRDISISDRIDRFQDRVRTPERSRNRGDSDIRNRNKDFDRPVRPDTGTANIVDNAAGLGLGLGLSEDLGEDSVQDNPLAQDQLQEEDTEQPPIEEPPQPPQDQEILRQDRSIFDNFDNERTREETFRQETDRPIRRRSDLDFGAGNDFVFEDSQVEGNPGANLGNEFAASLTASLFNIQADKDFDPDDFEGTGFEIRPLVDE